MIPLWRKLVQGAMSLVLLGVGFTLLLPGDTFDQSQSWRLFKLTGLTEAKCALMFLLTGLIGAAGINPGTISQYRRSLWLLSIVHLGLGLVFFIGSRFGAALWPYVVYGGLGFLMLWLPL